MEEFYGKQYQMSEFTDPKNYKTYDELTSRLNMVLGEHAPRTQKQSASLELDDSIPDFPSKSAPAAPTTAEPKVSTAESSMDDDDTMSYFAKLAAED